ncbi:hypothetical protein CSW98_00660 [Vibrio sp. HA2012]|uniref:YchJ family metal-binding protein n=1 Tax=Vibrio sp. HA2012 TaxID=1971595 RepID=UPI000C2C10A6|nr:YchJ family metal-binding protein [Vibrio sp. HA2012]PJC87673.1 hypothetical protein CSW98_00660 [Vibrio sp. HA2012]
MFLYPEGTLCPCGSQQSYTDCCQPIHREHSNAALPVQLMRARYCAHVLQLTDFVVATYHPSCHAETEREGIAESVHLNWQKLDILDAPTPAENEGFVEFKAWLQDEDGMMQCMHERSRFIKENGLWYYIDGVFPGEVQPESQKPVVAEPKTGRNDPCPCGSGKKYKKCCG